MWTDLHTRDTAQRAVESLPRRSTVEGLTALSASQDLITIGAIGAIGALHMHDLQHRVALAGLDDVGLASLLDPGVTVVARDPCAIGPAAAELPFARLDGYRGPAGAARSRRGSSSTAPARSGPTRASRSGDARATRLSRR